MARLSNRKSKLEFTTDDLVREQGKLREVVVEARPRTASVRLKGLRRSYTIEWSAIWSMAVKIQLAADREDRRAAKRR